uniref:Uncharacterized protein n=1 Tax=Tupiella akineta TaxID=160070 RepID=Q3ZJ08_TUPAK|nr:hypothetical protein PsakCp085 [Tupiella akineta]AAV80681.1 hypothetical protein [Tupiella akineta]
MDTQEPRVRYKKTILYIVQGDLNCFLHTPFQSLLQFQTFNEELDFSLPRVGEVDSFQFRRDVRSQNVKNPGQILTHFYTRKIYKCGVSSKKLHEAFEMKSSNNTQSKLCPDNLLQAVHIWFNCLTLTRLVIFLDYLYANLPKLVGQEPLKAVTQIMQHFSENTNNFVNIYSLWGIYNA